MASKKKGQPAKHCRIYQWVETQDSELAGAIHNLCLEGALSPSGGRGVTFLYPKDKAYRDEIVTKAYSEDADEAQKLIESLIIPEALLTAADFNRRAVGNKLGVRFVVESVEGSKVKLAGGVELVPAEDFRPLAKRANDIAVWVVAKGRAPLTGESYTAPAPARRGEKKARGGADGMVPSERFLLALKVENKFDLCMRVDRCLGHNPYLAKVVSLLNYLKVSQPDLFAKVLPVIDYDPVVTFYLLLEPYKTSGEFLIPNAALFGEGGWNCAHAYGNAVEDYKALFASGPKESTALVFRDRPAVMAQVDAMRLRYNGLAPRQGPQFVQDAYATLAAQNTVQGSGPVFPDSTLAALAGGKKLWQDEFRFIVHEALQTMRQMPYSPDVFGSIVRDIRACWPGNNYGGEVRLSNLADLRGNVAPRNELLLLGKFVNSTDFLYLSAPPDAVGAALGDPNNLLDWAVYNRNAAALANLNRIRGMVRPEGVSPQALQELQIYVRTHGGVLPPAVAALVGAV
jgi:hypothetical protein